MPRITTEQAPSAKPISYSDNLTINWITFAEIPDYDVPVVGFGISRRVAPGVGEFSGPILLTNYFVDTAKVDVRIVRGTRLLALPQTNTNFDVYDGGLGHVALDVITMTNGANVTVDAVDGVGKVTAFTLDTEGTRIQAVPEPLEQLTTTGVGTGFSITVADANLSTTDGHFYLCRNVPVEPQDTVVFPVNGQFLLTRDKLQIKANVDDYIHATVSYSEGQAEEDDIFF